MKRKDIFKGKYLAVADLDGKEWIVKISGARLEELGQDEDKESKLILYFDEPDKGMVCNVTNFDTIEALYGEDTEDWIGKTIMLYIDPKVRFKGKITPGLRVKEVPPREPGQEE